MAEIHLPASVRQRIVGVDLELAHPGQSIVRPQTSGRAIATTMGRPFWRGLIQFGPIVKKDIDEAELFFAQMSDLSNYCEFPIQRETFSGDDTTVSSGSPALYTLAAAPAGMAVGQYVRAGNSLLQVRSWASATRGATFWPSVPLDDGTTIKKGTTIRAIKEETGGIVNALNSGYGGPWSILIAEKL